MALFRSIFIRLAVGAGVALGPGGASLAAEGSTAVDAAGRDAWEEAFARSRADLVAGDFAAAAAALDALARRAPGPVEAAVAEALARLAREWATRGLALVPRAELGETALTAKAANRRTTGELAQLYITAVLYGVGTGGWLAVQTKPDSAAGGVLPALALAGAAAGGVAWADARGPLGYGVPQTMSTGAFLGLQQGILWMAWNQASVDARDEWSMEAVTTVVWGATTAGAAAGGIIGTLRGTTPGRAALVGSAATWTAAVAGLGTAALSTTDHTRDDHALLAAALGLNAGAVAGALAASPVSPSVARVRFIDLGGLSGTLLGGGLYLALADDDDDVDGRGLALATAVGMAGGLGVAWALTADMEPDRLEEPPAGTARLLLVPGPDGAPFAGMVGTF